MRNKLILIVLPFIGFFGGAAIAAEKGGHFPGLVPMPLVVNSVSSNATMLVAGDMPFILPEHVPVRSSGGVTLPHSSLREGQRVIIYISPSSRENFKLPATALGIQIMGRGAKDE